MSKLDQVVRVISDTTKPIKIIVFGSRSKNGRSSQSDLDIAVIQRSEPRLGQKAKIYLALNQRGYDWNPEPDIHLFSAAAFEKNLRAGDLFAEEVARGKTVYGG